MRKVTKILAMLLSATTLLLIILPLTLSLALSLHTVQSFVVERLTNFATEKIGAKVAIGGVNFTIPYDIELHDLIVEDLAGDTLAYSKCATARVSALSLLKKELVVSKLTLKDSELQLREVEAGMLNLKEILLKITNPDKEPNFRTSIGKIEVENLDFSLTRLAMSKDRYGVDLSNIVFEGINGSVSNFVSYKRITEFNVDKFSGIEQSGLSILSLSTQMVTYEGVVDFIDFKATTSTSQINLPKLRLESDTWEDYKDFNANVSIELLSKQSKLAACDVAYFAPELEGVDFVVNNLSFAANGTVDNIEAQIESLKYGRNTQLVGDLAIRGVVDLANAEFEVNIAKMQSSEVDINSCIVGFGSAALKDSPRQILKALGLFSLSGKASGSLDKINLAARVSGIQGSATYSGNVLNATSSPKVEGKITTNNLKLGNLLSNQALGAVTLAANVEYNGRDDVSVVAQISQLGYNSCTYSHLDIDASLSDNQIQSVVTSRDKNLDFDLETFIQLGENNAYDVTLRVRNANMHALALNSRDSISTISGSAKVKLRGNDLDNISGLVTLRNINYKYNDKSIYTPVIDLTARNNSKSKFISLESEFVDMTFNSKSSYQVLYDYLHNGVKKYIPLLYTADSERKSNKKVTVADNYSTLSVEFKEFSQVADAITSGFNIADNSSFNLMVNPFSERFSLRLKSDYIEHKELAATGLNINASNDNDSLSLYATASDIFAGRHSLSSATLMAGARNNVIELSTGFRDSLAGTSATLGMSVKFDGYQKANISLLPSQISMNDQMWMISASDISGTGASLSIKDFAMVNGDQELLLDGTISKEPTDSLVLKLKDYDISLITSVVNSMGYSIGGLSNGYVQIRQLLENPRIVADVALDSIYVNSIPSPPLNLTAGWDTKENRASVLVTNRDDQRRVATGYYAPSDGRYFANLQVDSLNMALIDPLLKGTITDTKGYADVDVSLRGQHKEASLDGTIDAYDLKTMVDFTQVEYFVPEARIEVNNNKFTSQARPIFDRDGNGGLITLNMSLDQLSNVTYNVRIVPENMLVLNTTEQDNELFYGTLYASGVATIRGDRRGVDMEITATSKPNSSFFMPLSGQSAVAKTDFITFVQKKKVVDESPTTNFRRTYIRERNQRMNSGNAGRMNITMALHATPDLDFQLVIDPVVGDIIKAKGEGRFNINVDPQANLFEIYGDYNITEGNYLFALLNPISKRFVIESGSSIQWTGDAIDPILNIDAIYKVKTSLDPLISSTSSSDDSSSSRSVPVDCIIHLGDRLSQPSVDFSIDVPTADTEQQAIIANTLIDQETISQQFFYLMLANSFVSVSSNSSGLSSSSTASTGFELLTNQLSNWLSSSNYNVVIRYRPESDLTSDEVDLGFSRGLIDNRLLIEVEGNYLADNKTMDESNFSNFMGEAYVTWLIDRAGTLRLKGFTQTIDRYDENQGLQETGIGVYYSESFDTFKELKRKIFNRFKRKKNK